jgi:probable rRNA maturation factor
MINLQVRPKLKLSMDKAIIINAAQLTLDLENVTKDSTLSVVIANDAFLEKNNQKYRGINATTDVLSFPSNEYDSDTHVIYLGDVLISLPRAQYQAAAGGHSLVDELQLLVIHGALHLLGYDHLGRVDKKKMQAAQDRILTQLGVNLKIKL